MIPKIQDELLRFCKEHINNHGADFRAEFYIKGCCKLWAEQFCAGLASKVESLAMEHYMKKGGK